MLITIFQYGQRASVHINLIFIFYICLLHFELIISLNKWMNIIISTIKSLLYLLPINNRNQASINKIVYIEKPWEKLEKITNDSNWSSVSILCDTYVNTKSKHSRITQVILWWKRTSWFSIKNGRKIISHCFHFQTLEVSSHIGESIGWLKW